MFSISGIHQQLRRTTFRIRILEADGIWWGTDFFISRDGLALTAYHNLPKPIRDQGRGTVDVYYHVFAHGTIFPVPRPSRLGG